MKQGRITKTNKNRSLEDFQETKAVVQAHKELKRKKKPWAIKCEENLD